LKNKACQKFYEEFSKNKDQVYKAIKYSSTNQKSEIVASGYKISKDSENEEYD
jgi:hypothetical protein